MARWLTDQNGRRPFKWEIPERGDIVTLSDEYIRQHPNSWRKGQRAIVLRDSVVYGCVWLQWGGETKSVICCSNLTIVERFNLFQTDKKNAV